jgi:hypothetical protein
MTNIAKLTTKGILIIIARSQLFGIRRGVKGRVSNYWEGKIG